MEILFWSAVALGAVIVAVFVLLGMASLFLVGRWEPVEIQVGQHLRKCARRRGDGLLVIGFGHECLNLYVVNPGPDQVALEEARSLEEAVVQADRLFPPK
ncbi:MAG: hypothetical protein ABIJ46_01875 [bacterium]